jgi:hypothetical protein
MHRRCGVLLGCVVVAVPLLFTPVLQAEPDIPPILGYDEPLPASPKDPDRDSQHRQREHNRLAARQQRLSSSQLRDFVLNHPDPALRAKARQALTQRPEPQLAASADRPPHEASLQQEPSSEPGDSISTMSLPQLRQLVLTDPNPSIRAKAQTADRAKHHRQGSLLIPALSLAKESFLSLLSPTEGWAAVSPDVITLTPEDPIAANHELSSYGCVNEGARFSILTCDPCSSLPTCPFYRAPNGTAVSSPYFQVDLSIDQAATYIIDFYGIVNGSPRPLSVSLYHRASPTSYPKLESWSLLPVAPYHFSTVQNLAAGRHRFLLVVHSGSVTMDEFRRERLN